MQRESHQTYIAQQLEHDQLMRTEDRLHGLIAQGAKGLGVLNAGAVVAMLAFVQALIGTTQYVTFKIYVIWALSFFLMGTALAATVFFFHYRFINSGQKKRWYQVVWGLLIVSALCAIVGGTLVTLGIYVAV